MLKQSINNLYRHELEKRIKEEECDTVDGLLDILFGTYDNDYHSGLVVKRKWVESEKSTVLQRLNTLWVYPLFICMMPFRYLLFGRPQFSEDSKLGRVIIFLTGEMR